ncbi:succinylglutamate desuccinylase/aspartoacylase family protein [Natrinema salifodinae]|uniref:Predicted deacylase n=1 Tax=Natrinema salifodinae TaxID=1202768 RepID=A0A1I0Q947_9EURY|nr:succinylglutamate desuccinylase/aspartoacylase family protein [Natrinema salifodinae]SEW23394.1 Predicted deacylase [Natrinema salifodinae]
MTDGTHTADRVTLARLPSGVELTTTVHTYRGSESESASDSAAGSASGSGAAPTLYVQAAQHGREVNGTEVLRRFHERLPLDSLSGTVIAVPVANPLTFDRVSYTTPEQLDSVNPNMNRVWPGDADGSLHQRMAARLWEYVATADAVVDLHTGSPDMLPHVVYREGDRRSRELGEAFGTDLLLSEQADEDAPEEWHRRGFAGKLRVAAADEGIPSITPELSHNKQILEDAVEDGVDGLLDVCRYLDLLPGDAPERDQVVARNHLGQVSADDAGLFRPNPSIAVGDSIAEGDPIGTVHHPTTYDPLHEARADRDGVLYALTREATVTAGDQLASVALVREE